MTSQKKPREWDIFAMDEGFKGRFMAEPRFEFPWKHQPNTQKFHVREVLPDAEAPAEFDEALKNFMDNVEKTGPANSFTQGWNAGFQQGLKAGSRNVNIVELENENKDMKSALVERDAEIEALKQEVQDAYSQGYVEAQERLDD